MDQQDQTSQQPVADDQAVTEPTVVPDGGVAPVEEAVPSDAPAEAPVDAPAVPAEGDAAPVVPGAPVADDEDAAPAQA